MRSRRVGDAVGPGLQVAQNDERERTISSHQMYGKVSDSPIFAYSFACYGPIDQTGRSEWERGTIATRAHEELPNAELISKGANVFLLFSHLPFFLPFQAPSRTCVQARCCPKPASLTRPKTCGVARHEMVSTLIVHTTSIRTVRREIGEWRMLSQRAGFTLLLDVKIRVLRFRFSLFSHC